MICISGELGEYKFHLFVCVQLSFLRARASALARVSESKNRMPFQARLSLL